MVARDEWIAWAVSKAHKNLLAGFRNVVCCVTQFAKPTQCQFESLYIKLPNTEFPIEPILETKFVVHPKLNCMAVGVFHAHITNVFFYATGTWKRNWRYLSRVRVDVLTNVFEFAPRSFHLAFPDNVGLRVVDARSGKTIARVGDRICSDIAFHSREKFVAATFESCVQIWRYGGDWSLLHTIEPNCEPTCLRFHPEEAKLFVGLLEPECDSKLSWGMHRGRLGVWDLSDDGERIRPHKPVQKLPLGITNFRFVRLRQESTLLLVALLEDNVTCLIDYEKETVLHCSEIAMGIGSASDCFAADFASPDGSVFEVFRTSFYTSMLCRLTLDERGLKLALIDELADLMEPRQKLYDTFYVDTKKRVLLSYRTHRRNEQRQPDIVEVHRY